MACLFNYFISETDVKLMCVCALGFFMYANYFLNFIYKR